MSKYSLVKLIENEDFGGDQTRLRQKGILRLYPKQSSLDDVIKALENAENYGMYISNLRNLDFFKKKFDEKFGTPQQRRNISRGGKVISTAKFEPYTADAAEKYIGTVLNDDIPEAKKTTILKSVINWVPSDDRSHLILKYDSKNPIDTLTKKANYILTKAGMDPETAVKIALEKD